MKRWLIVVCLTLAACDGPPKPADPGTPQPPRAVADPQPAAGATAPPADPGVTPVNENYTEGPIVPADIDPNKLRPPAPFH